MSSKFQWSHSKYDQLVAVAKNTIMRSGITCCFFPISKTVGAKLYCNRRVRDHASKLQKMAHSHGLAPNSGEPFEFVCLNFCFDRYDVETETYSDPRVDRQTVYGYLTQIAKMHRGIFAYRKEVELVKKLRAVGINHNDLHGGNVGYINDKLVCIDFDMISCSKVRGRKPNAGKRNKNAERRKVRTGPHSVQSDPEGRAI